jgi:hypothetical protein
LKVYLYSTLGCHLCEQAKVILWPLLDQYQCQLVEVDIAGSDELIERYGVRIPVVAGVLNGDSDDYAEELSWPFSSQDANKFFEEMTKS